MHKLFYYAGNFSKFKKVSGGGGSSIFRSGTVCRKTKSNLAETNFFFYGEVSHCENCAHGGW